MKCHVWQKQILIIWGILTMINHSVSWRLNHLEQWWGNKKKTWTHLEHTSKVMLKILQARLQQYMNCELLDVQSAFRKGRGTRAQIADIRWIIEKPRKCHKNIYCFINYAKAFDCVDHQKQWDSSRYGNTIPPDLPLEKPVYRSGSNS